MNTTASKSAENRQNGKHQVSGRRASILAAAERLFLENGLERTSMVDIAKSAGITKVTLYRYFADRDPIAAEIAAQMLMRIAAATNVQRQALSLENLRELAQAMIRNFNCLREVYRYIGMFDQAYGDRYPNDTLAAWLEQHAFSPVSNGKSYQEIVWTLPQGKQIVMILNAIMSFLERMAGRDESKSGAQAVPLEDQLNLFAEMVDVYFDRLMGPRRRSRPR